MTAIATKKSSTLRISTRISTWAGIAVALTLGITSKSAQPAATSINPAAANTSTPAPKKMAKSPHRWYQLGLASWYGKYFQGHPTASGESYNMFDFTCAHRSLPLGSLVRITNLRNHKSVVVRVNDRGPVPDDRIVDLSYAAANTIGVNGVSKVRVDLVSTEAHLNWPAPAGR
jgi:rare lipoprotein A